MKLTIKVTHLFFLVFLFAFNSCRKEEVQLIQPPEDETLVSNSLIVDLIKRTVSNDGSIDNIIDNANCFRVQLPVTVAANDIEITVNSEADYAEIEDVFDEFDDDNDTLEIFFPITIILEDYSLVTIDNYNELSNYSNTCNGENRADDDIECVDFQYPIKASIFNVNNEMLETIILNNDEMLYKFIDGINQFDLVTMDFPIAILLPDGSSRNVENLNELENVIETNRDNCDEDDDNNYNDDDCNECTISQLTNYLTGCSDWAVDQLERDNSSNTEDYYAGYVFNFYPDGTLVSQYFARIYPGTWTATGSANNITVVIDIPSLPDCNNNWILHEIEQNPGETKVDLRLGEEQIRYVNDCN